MFLWVLVKMRRSQVCMLSTAFLILLSFEMNFSVKLINNHLKKTSHLWFDYMMVIYGTIYMVYGIWYDYSYFSNKIFVKPI